MRLSGIRRALLEELKGDGARLSFINTRLILSIGVNLNEIAPDTDGDGNIVSTTLATLRKMGFLNREDNRVG